jgi:hypothetical protein
MEGLVHEHEDAAHVGVRQKLGHIAAKWFREAVRGKHERVDARTILLEQQIKDEDRMRTIAVEAQRSNMLNLKHIGKGECVFVKLLRHGSDGHLYGHERQLLLQRYCEDGEAPLFKVTGDTEKIYEKTNSAIQPFRDFDAIRISSARPSALTGEREFIPFLDYGEPFSFRLIAGEVEQSDYKVAQVSVAHADQIYDLLSAPERETAVFRG